MQRLNKTVKVHLFVFAAGAEAMPQPMNPGYPPQPAYSAPYPTEPPPTYNSVA